MSTEPSPPASNPASASSGGARWFLALVLLSGLAIGVWLLFFSGRNPQPGAPPENVGTPRDSQPSPEERSYTLEQASQLLRDKNRALGLLENEKLVEVEPLWTELATRVPDDPLPTRNLVVTRLLMLKAGQTTGDVAWSACEQALAREPGSAALLQLSGRVAALAAEKEADATLRDEWLVRSIKALRQAAILDKNSASLRYELFTALRYARDPERLATARVAITEAAALAPNNLFVLADALQSLAEAKSAELLTLIPRARAALTPVQPGILKRARVDVHQFLDEAAQFVTDQKWTEASAKLRVVATVTRPEEYAQSDRKLVDPYPLEFVLSEFSLPAITLALKNPTIESPRTERPLPKPIVAPRKFTGPLGTITAPLDALPCDANLDGAPDVAVLSDSSFSLHTLPTTGDSVQLATIAFEGRFEHLVLGDLDRDGTGKAAAPDVKAGAVVATAPPGCFEAAPDFIVWGPAGVRVLLTQRPEEGNSLVMAPVAQEQGLEKLTDVTALSLLDLDQEGDLDLVVATTRGLSLWINRGDLQFEEITARSTFGLNASGANLLTAVDWDRDIDIDLVCTGPKLPGVCLLENLRHGEFRLVPLIGANRAPVDRAGVVDLDGNASWDLLVSEKELIVAFKTDTPVRGRVSVLPAETLSPAEAPVDEFITSDINCDGFDDLILRSEKMMGIVLGYGSSLLPRGPVLDFMQTAAIPLATRSIHEVNLDNDQDLDLVVTTPEGVMAIVSETNDKARSLFVRVFGENDPQSGRVNQYNIGGLLEVRSGDRYQARTIKGQSTHFGLGPQDADVLRVLFTNGVPQAAVSPKPSAALCEKQILKGSCPYLYTWTGDRFEFFTDLLWAAPLGLQIAEDVLLPDRPWEYLKIDADRLVPRNGRYELRVTSELWEADYFDQIELFAVDHPADVDIVSNEKVGPPDLATFGVHAIRDRRLPVAARDQSGRDLLAEVLHDDGRYAKCFSRTFKQGLAEPHALELDLGEFDASGPVTLFLRGWIFPTDTSLNVALTQDPTLEGPKPPSLWVIGQDGQWTEARPFMGFPGGKPKTIAVDLTGLFPTSDHRVQIRTSHELYWDSACFTVGERPASESTDALVITPLSLKRADLAWRGFSEVTPRGETTPEQIDYSRVSESPKWPPMVGPFTRYGTVNDLLTQWDDLLVVMSPGDELRLEFDAGPPVKPGWKRSFVLHNVGWDKDADLHTIYGQTVDPLPFKAMSRYPFAPDDTPPASPEYLHYLRTYQTREQPWKSFRKP